MDRSLRLFMRQTLMPQSLVIVNDGDDEWNGERSRVPSGLAGFSGLLSIVHLRDEGIVRPPNTALRQGYPWLKAAGAEYVIVWYPEILAPPFAVERMVDRHVPGHRDVAPLMALSERQTRSLGALDLTDWRAFAEWATSDPNFLSQETPLRITNAQAYENLHHLNFTGALVAEWDRFGFLPNTDARAQNENWLREQEVRANVLPRACGFEVWHQWHPRLFPNEERRSARIDRIQGGSGGLA
jgi:hypothetical protein